MPGAGFSLLAEQEVCRRRDLLSYRPVVRWGADAGTPLTDQTANLAPLGRSIRLSLRRQF